MPDYGHDLLFGVFVPPSAQQADEVLALARRADEAGLDLVSVQDHPYNPEFLDAWTLLTTIAATGVEPTPDTGVRLSAERLWDEAERPHGPAPAPDADYPAAGQALAGDLVAVHNHLRGELAQLRDMIAQVADGSLDPGAARSEISKLTMRQNQWTVGAYCESYCRLVGMHHTIEDRSLFPGLRSLDGRLTPVVDRLHSEHVAIAGVLARVNAALIALVTAPAAGMPELRAAVDLLTDTLLSHLSYEERELVEPLGRLGPALYG